MGPAAARAQPKITPTNPSIKAPPLRPDLQADPYSLKFVDPNNPTKVKFTVTNVGKAKSVPANVYLWVTKGGPAPTSGGPSPSYPTVGPKLHQPVPPVLPHQT